MPNETFTGRKVVGGFALGLAILAVMGWVSYQTTLRLVELGSERNRAHLIVEHLQELFSELQDAETGERGFVITGDERYLEPYLFALKGIEQTFQDLRGLGAHDPALQRRLDSLTALAKEKLDELRQLVDVRRSKGFQAALLLVQTGQGKRTMDAIRAAMDEVKSEQNAVVARRNMEVQATESRTIAVILFGSLLSVAVVALATLLINRDLANRKRAEQFLRQSEEKFRTLFNSIDEGFCIIELLFDANSKAVDYRFLETNTSFEKQTGIAHAQGKTMREIAPQHEEHWFEMYGKIALTGEAVRFENEAAQLHRWYDVYAFRIGEPKQGKVAILFSDITLRKRTEEEMQTLNRDLQKQTVELAAVNRELEAFSYSVSHDLRAPLRSIDGFSLALLEDYSDVVDEAGKDFLQRVRSATQRMSQLIDDLIDLSRVSRVQICHDTVSLTALAKSIARELQTSETDREVEFAIAEDLNAKGDENLLRIVLENLLRNAWKFSSKRSAARIELAALGPEDGRQIYVVRDNGAGFDMEYAGNLFSPFQRLHSAAEFKGTGVGLATVQRIIHRHGGRVWAEAQVGQGASFFFTL